MSRGRLAQEAILLAAVNNKPGTNDDTLDTAIRIHTRDLNRAELIDLVVFLTTGVNQLHHMHLGGAR
jgi:HD superfamily phosphohydrolase YqeK